MAHSEHMFQAATSTSNKMQKMDDDSSLQIFQLHLPDPDQLLFIEQWKNTNTFHGFSKLPVELRLMIWQATFGRARVRRINPIVVLNIARNGDRFSHHCRKENPLPVALFVNTESRVEASRFFCIYHQESPPGHDRLLKPLFFNSSKDILFICTSFMFMNHRPRALGGPEKYRNIKTLVSELTSQQPKHMSKVKHLKLEFSHISVDPLDIRTIFNKNAPNGDIVEGHPSFHSAIIFHFTALEHIIMEYCSCDGDIRFRRIKDDLKMFLEENSHRFCHGRVPRIYVVKKEHQSRRVLYAGYD